MSLNKRRSVLRVLRNQMVALGFGTFLGGFILAIYLGAFSSGAFENLTNWLAVLVAAVAAGISLYAVRLVAQTLKATQDTLSATVRMAEDQKKIGNAQIRPWVMVSNANVNRDPEYNVSAYITVKNFGNTPARFIRIVSRLRYPETPNEDGPYINHVFEQEMRHHLPPKDEMTIERDVTAAINSMLNEGQLFLRVEYFDTSGKSDTELEPWHHEIGFRIYDDPDGPVIQTN